MGVEHVWADDCEFNYDQYRPRRVRVAVHHVCVWPFECGNASGSLTFSIKGISCGGERISWSRSVSGGPGNVTLSELLSISEGYERVKYITEYNGPIGSGDPNACNVRTLLYDAITDHDRVIAWMINTPCCSPPAEGYLGNGKYMWVTMADLGLYYPPRAYFTIASDGVDEDGIPVAEPGSSVCFFGTGFSYNRPAAEINYTWTDSQQGQIATEKEFCTVLGGIGDHYITLHIDNGVGSGEKTQIVRIQRPPVILLHGYWGKPKSMKAIENKLSEEGFNVYSSLDLRRKTRGSLRLTSSVDLPAGTVEYGQLMEEITLKFLKSKIYEFNMDFEFSSDPITKWILETWVSKGIPINKTIFSLNEVIDNIPINITFETKNSYIDLLAGKVHIEIWGDYQFIFPVGTPITKILSISFDEDDGLFGVFVKIKGKVDIPNHKLSIEITPLFSLSGFSLTLANGDLVDYVKDLENYIQQIKQETGAKRVDIVGHDMGGLIGRWYSQYSLNKDIRKIILIGSENHGADVFFALPELAKWIVELLVDAFIKDIPYVGPFLGEIITQAFDQFVDLLMGPAAKQMYPHSSYIFAINTHNDDRPDTKEQDVLYDYTHYEIIQGADRPTLIHEHLGNIFGFQDPIYPLPTTPDFVVPFIESGDWVVPNRSVQLSGVSRTIVYDGHIDIKNVDKTLDKIVEILLDDPPFTGVSGGNDNSIDELVQAIIPDTGVLKTGEKISKKIKIDTGILDVRFYVNFIGGEPLVSIFDPSGNLIPPSSPKVEYTSLHDMIEYNITNPDTGDWLVVVENPLPSDITFAVGAYLRTDVYIAMLTDKSVYSPNEPIRIIATPRVNNSTPSWGRVYATVSAPAGVMERIELFDDGQHGDGYENDGFFANWYTKTSISGPYTILVNGEFVKANRRYERSTQIAVSIEKIPDLTISPDDITFSPSSPKHNEEVEIYARVTNLKDAIAKNAKINFYDGDPANGGKSIGSVIADIPGNNYRDVSIKARLKYGLHNIFVIIAPYGEYTEMAYTNNTAFKVLNVAPVTLIADAGPSYQRTHRNIPVILDGSCSYGDAPIVEYEWRFLVGGQEVKLYGQQVSYSFPLTGQYTVTLKVTDDTGRADEDTTVVDVVLVQDHGRPHANAGTDRTVYVDQPILLNGSGSSDNFGIAWYAWNIDRILGPGTDYTSRCALIENGYKFPGEYTVELTVDDVAGNGPRIDTATIAVLPRPTEIEYIGVNTGEGATEVKLIALLKETINGKGVPNEHLNFILNGQPVTALTGEDGIAIAHLTIAQPEGEHTLKIEFLGSRRYTASFTELSFTVTDTTPPIIWITSPETKNYLKTETITLNFGAYDPVSGLASFNANLDGLPVQSGDMIDLFYYSLGEHSVNLEATDNKGLVRTLTRTFYVIADLSSTEIDVNKCSEMGWIDNWGIENSLKQKLRAAKAAEERGQLKPMENILNAFINEVLAQRGKHINEQCADILIADAEFILESYGLTPKK